MQKKLAASFLLVILFQTVLFLVVPRFHPRFVWNAPLIICLELGIGLAAAWVVSHLLTRKLRVLASATTLIARGDLTRQVEVRGHDETADLAHSFSVMVDSLLNVVIEVQSTAEKINESAVALSGASEQMNAATEQIAEAAREIEEGATRQAEQVVETSIVTSELARTVERVGASALEVDRAAATAAEKAAAGVQDARLAADGIAELSDAIATSTEAVEGFRAKSYEIGKIVSFIASLSQQTHILAVNAAIEAARAGDEGRGFAVVAEEVRRLADNVRAFAEQIAIISTEITEGASSLALGIRESVGAAGRSREVVTRAATSFEEIQSATTETARLATEISVLTAKQREASANVVSALEKISAIAALNATGTEQTSAAAAGQTASAQHMAASASALARTSEELQDLVSIFKVR